MDDLKDLQTKFMAAAAVLGLAVLAFALYLIWPGSSRAAQEQEKTALQEKFSALNREVGLWESSNPEKVRADLNVLYKGIPGRDSEISQRLEKLFQESGVTPSGAIKYSFADSQKSELPGVQRIKIDATVTGDYAKLGRFINAMEQDPLLFVIEKISLSSQTEGNSVSLQMTFETYLKGAA